MSSLALGITTAPRDDLYLDKSLESLREAGFDEKVHIFAEPDSPEPSQDSNFIIHTHEGDPSCFRNFKFALTWLLENTDEDWLLLCQDDTIYRDDCKARLEEGMRNHDPRLIGFLSPYCAPPMAGQKSSRVAPIKGEGWADVVLYRNGFWGALTLAFPRESAEKIVNSERFVNHNHHRKVDVVVGKCCSEDLKLAIKVHIPSLAHHIGQKSTLGRDKIVANRWARKGYGFKPSA